MRRKRREYKSPWSIAWKVMMISPVVGVRFIICPDARSDDNSWVSLPQLSHCLAAGAVLGNPDFPDPTAFQ